MKTYSKKEILNQSINDKTPKQKIIPVFFKINNFEFGVILKPNYVSNYHHFSFYAISPNLEKFTSTGYKSIFAISSNKIFSLLEIKKFLLNQLKENDIDVFKPTTPIQLSLF